MKNLVVGLMILCQVKYAKNVSFRVEYGPAPEGGIAAIVQTVAGVDIPFNKNLEENEVGEAFPAGSYKADGIKLEIDENGDGLAITPTHTSKITCVSN